ncbi:MAG: GntR family transcriptional regulator [Fibrobacteres bacterium]|nr:GntR family transcriptional regulator [Fibrobacterota bacterium]
MDFHSSKAIYQQIGDYICGKILSNEWSEDERLPSVRDLAITLSVNPNTVMRTCIELENRGILYNKRGIGLFVAKGGIVKAKLLLREEFELHVLPALLSAMTTLKMDADDLYALVKKHLNERK